MSFFADFFHTVDKKESVVLVDVGTSSVAGAYVHYKKGQLPEVLYTRRLPIEIHSGEEQEAGMLRALKILGETLIKEGAPVLARATGSGTANSILLSIDAPWQKTTVRVETYEEKQPFVFTKGLVNDLLKKTSAKSSETEYIDESIIGTLLNGYETAEPYGQKAHRASIIILTSHIETKIAKTLLASLQSVYHTKQILPVAGDSLRYQAMRTIYPYEHDALLIDATGPITSVALIRNSLFTSLLQLEYADSPQEWVAHVSKQLRDLAQNYPLPRSIFLITRESDGPPLRQAFEDAKLGELWLSDTPPRILSVAPNHFTSFARQVSTAPPDVILLLMAVYWEHRKTT